MQVDVHHKLDKNKIQEKPSRENYQTKMTRSKQEYIG